jgi:hypothetical protein
LKGGGFFNERNFQTLINARKKKKEKKRRKNEFCGEVYKVADADDDLRDEMPQSQRFVGIIGFIELGIADE